MDSGIPILPMGKPFGPPGGLPGFWPFLGAVCFFLMAKVTFVHLVERKGKLAEEKKEKQLLRV